MRGRIKNEKRLLAQTKIEGFSQDGISGHIISTFNTSMHNEVFEDVGKTIEDYVDGMRYRHHHLYDWMMTFEVTDEDRRDCIILPSF